MSEFWLISAPGDKENLQALERMNAVTSKSNLSYNTKFSIPDFKVKFLGKAKEMMVWGGWVSPGKPRGTQESKQDRPGGENAQGKSGWDFMPQPRVHCGSCGLTNTGQNEQGEGGRGQCFPHLGLCELF